MLNIKKTILIVGLSGLVLLIGITLIIGYLNQEPQLNNEIIELNASTERAVEITEETTELPVSLPNNIPFEVEDEYASVNIYNFEGNEEYHEATFNFENETQLLKVVISNVEAEREEGRKIQFGNDKKVTIILKKIIRS